MNILQTRKEVSLKAFSPYKHQTRWVSWVDEDGKKMPINPYCRHRSRASTSDSTTWGEYEWAKMSAMQFGLSGVGFVFHDRDDVVGVDLDDCRHIITGEIDQWAQDIVVQLNSYAEVSPSGTGLKIWCKHKSLAKAHKDNAIGIEIYPFGRYFTVTGQAIWDAEIVDASLALDAVIAKYFSRPEYAEQSRLASFDFGEPKKELVIDDWIGDALSYIDPDGGYNQWINVGMALHNGYQGSTQGIARWTNWSSKSKHFSVAEIESKWRSFSGVGISPGTIWDLAKNNGWSYRAKDNDWGVFGGLEKSSEIAVDHDVTSSRDEMQRIQWMDAAALYDDKRPYDPYLVDPQIIGKSDVIMLFGPPKSMKTLVSMDMCRHWAAGLPWMDLTVQRPLRIAYFNFEIKKDNLRRRLQLASMSDDHVASMRGNFWLTNRFVDSFGAKFVEESLTSLAAQTSSMTQGKGWDLIVIDPLIDLFNGDSENDNKQVKDFINGLKRLAHNIDPDAALMLVHHANKTNRKDRHAEPFNSLRGGSAFRGSYDTGISIDWESESRDILRIAFECRNGPGAENRRVAFSKLSGMFESRGSLVGDRTSERKAGEVIGETWDAEALRKAKRICDILINDAKMGRIYTSLEFSQVYANTKHGLSGEKTIRRKIDEMMRKGVLGYFNPADFGLHSGHHRSKGHICCEGMEYHTDDGEVIDILPSTFFDFKSGDFVKTVDETILLSNPEFAYS